MNDSNASSSSSSMSKHQPIDTRIREIMNNTAVFDSNPTSNHVAKFDDITGEAEIIGHFYFLSLRHLKSF